MAVSLTTMNVNSAYSRRMQFRRSHTMVDCNSEEDNENESEYNEESKLIHKTDSPLLPRDNNVISQSPTHRETSLRNMPSNETTMRQRSHTVSWDTLTTAPNFTNAKSKDHHPLGISTLQILTQMKDRIQQKYMFYSSEWPDEAAIVYAKYRERAIEAIESLSSRIECSKNECVPMQDLGVRDQTIPRLKRGRYSIPTTSTQSLEAPSKVNGKYLKRRSVSEGQVEHNRRTGRGIVCSNEDLRSIMWDYKKRGSVHFRTYSDDYTNLQKMKLESLSSKGSSSVGARKIISDDNNLIGSTMHLYPDVLVQSSEIPAISQNFTNLAADSNDNILPKKDTESGLDIVFEEPRASCENDSAYFDPEILGSAIEIYLDSIIQSKSSSDCNLDADSDIISHSYSDEVSIECDDIAEESEGSVGFWTRLLCIFRGQDVTDDVKLFDYY